MRAIRCGRSALPFRSANGLKVNCSGATGLTWSGMAEPPADRNRITFDSCQLGGCGEARCGRVQAIPRERRGRWSSCRLRVPSVSGGTLPRRRRRSVWFPRSSGAMLDVDRLERQQDRSLHPSRKDRHACPRGCLDDAQEAQREPAPVQLEAPGRTARPSTGPSRQRMSLNQRVDSLSGASRSRPQRRPLHQGPEPALAHRRFQLVQQAIKCPHSINASLSEQKQGLDRHLAHLDSPLRIRVLRRQQHLIVH